MPPVKGATSVIPFDYRLILELQVLSKAYFFQLRICIEDLLKILNRLHEYLEIEPNGNILPARFPQFVDYILTDKHRNLDNRIVSLLDELIVEFTILRFIRNYLKTDGILLFVIRYYYDRFRIIARFEFGKINDNGIKKLIESERIKLDSNLIFFDLDGFSEKVYLDIERLKRTIEDILLERLPYADTEECNSVKPSSSYEMSDEVCLFSGNILEEHIPGEINLDEGTFMVAVTINGTKSTTPGQYNIYSNRKDNGLFSIYLLNSGTLTVVHELEGIRKVISADYTDFLNRCVIIAVVWNIRQNRFELYLDGQRFVEVNESLQMTMNVRS